MSLRIILGLVLVAVLVTLLTAAPMNEDEIHDIVAQSRQLDIVVEEQSTIEYILSFFGLDTMYRSLTTFISRTWFIINIFRRFFFGF